jgi:glycosyltransferase involved in cell wall biosynthesis
VKSSAHDVVDLVIVVDDASQDDTMKLAQGLEKVVAHRHPKNLGYGGNQKPATSSRSTTARTSW